jgi:hypothetical protein
MAVEMASVGALESPKGTQGVFELPCGYVDAAGVLHTEIVLRELTGSEEDLLASKQLSAFKKYNELLVRCTQRIGTITDRGQIAAAVKALPVGDRLFLLFAIRRVSIGDEYLFEEVCPNSSCKKTNTFTVLLSELEVKKMPEPQKRIYDAILPSGATARFRISTGLDEEKAMATEAKTEDSALSKGILMRLELLNGAPPELQAVKDMKWRDRVALREKWNTVEGGVDTETDMACPACGHEYKKDIEVTPSFFFPSATSKA